MRDLIVFTIVFASLPFVLWRPYFGIYMWSWMGYFNPHRATFGPAFLFPFSQIIGICTLAGMLFTKEKRWPPLMPLTVFWFIFIVWMNVTTPFALNPEDAALDWSTTMKIQLMSIVTVMLIIDRRKLEILVAVIALSIGFYGVKNGIYSLFTGAESRVFGPTGTFIEDNNDFALALVMVLPLVRFLQLQAKVQWQRIAFLAAVLLMAVSIAATHSRGGMLGGAAMALVLWWRSGHKFWTGIGLLLAIPFLLWFLPDHWFERMDTIKSYEQDSSAMGRINAWWFSWYVALDRPWVGGGFDVFSPEQFLVYAPDPLDFHDAHSSYFEVLAEHGFIGLGLWLLLGATALFTAGRIFKQTRGKPELEWAHNLAGLLQVSLIGYAVSGAFLGRAYFDLYFHIIAIIVVLRALVPAPAPAHAVQMQGTAAPEPR
jgi:putative inorganic carbon (hco3(-)) transporter